MKKLAGDAKNKAALGNFRFTHATACDEGRGAFLDEEIAEETPIPSAPPVMAAT
jgi:hypothetical protein